MLEAGLFYNVGNKLTAESGFIYQAGVEAKFGKDVLIAHSFGGWHAHH
ncbi:hypothetical protein [Pseudomonas mucidolens]|nr:hypothetical protein [Pseudomonas mucidolens]SQH33829.1 Uncharacterised protein [Pseudomonas mucidolens]